MRREEVLLALISSAWNQLPIPAEAAFDPDSPRGQANGVHRTATCLRCWIRARAQSEAFTPYPDGVNVTRKTRWIGYYYVCDSTLHLTMPFIRIRTRRSPLDSKCLFSSFSATPYLPHTFNHKFIMDLNRPIIDPAPVWSRLTITSYCLRNGVHFNVQCVVFQKIVVQASCLWRKTCQ